MDKYRLATQLLIPMIGLHRKLQTYGSCFCPFHTNENSEAGHLYKDPDGVERLYCYVCHRQFTSADALVEFHNIKDFKNYLYSKNFTEKQIDKAYNIVFNSKHKEVEIPEFKTGEQFFKKLYLGDYYNV